MSRFEVADIPRAQPLDGRERPSYYYYSNLPSYAERAIRRARAFHRPLAQNERFSFKLFLTVDLFSPLAEYMVKALFKAFSLDSLPLFIIRVAQKNCILSGNDRRTLRQRHHLTLHHFLDSPRDLHDELFRLTSRFDLRVARGLF